MKRLTLDDVYEHCGAVCFKNGPPGTVGLETEWFVFDPLDTGRHIAPRIWQALIESAGYPADSALPGGGRITEEPGGQLEISSAPHDSLSALRQALTEDLDRIRKALSPEGLVLVAQGVDPARRPLLQSDSDRYRCMSAYFGEAGLAMMCTTAALQVCLDIGADASDAARRWYLANSLAPVFVAVFANSPLQALAAGPHRRTGLKSTRHSIWEALDPGRTSQPPDVDADPASAWARYALDARIMMVRDDRGGLISAPAMTFREWLTSDGPGPTKADLEYHLTTLFPPVRPHGWLELRMIDALPDAYWTAAAALTTALLDDPAAADVAAEVAEQLNAQQDIGLRAARDALADPTIAKAADMCFTAAGPALARLGAQDLLPMFEDYHERFVVRGRCPADDVLDGIASWSGSPVSHERTAA